MGVETRLDTNMLDGIITRVDTRAARILHDAGGDLADMTRAVIREMDVLDTGRLLGSVDYHATNDSIGAHTGIVSVGAHSNEGFPYPIAQHEGYHDKGGGWHAGRPFLRVAIERFKPYFTRNYWQGLF